MTTPTTPAADAVSLVPIVAHMLSTEGHAPILTFDKSRFLARDSFEDLVLRKDHLAALDAATARESALVAERDALRAALISLRDRLVACSEMPVSAAEAFDSFYQSEVDEALALAAPAVEG